MGRRTVNHNQTYKVCMPTVYFRHLSTLPAFLFCGALTANTLEESYLASSEAGVTIEASYTYFNQDLDAIGYL
ncbi:MAG: hypothetical protein VW874_12680, partial [Gammaproteobacteria bacterium]